MSLDIDTVFDELAAAQVVCSQQELSRYMGQGESYLSSLKAKGKEPSLTAWTILFVKLAKAQEEFEQGLGKDAAISNDDFIRAAAIYRVKKGVFAKIQDVCLGKGVAHAE